MQRASGGEAAARARGQASSLRELQQCLGRALAGRRVGDVEGLREQGPLDGQVLRGMRVDGLPQARGELLGAVDDGPGRPVLEIRIALPVDAMRVQEQAGAGAVQELVHLAADIGIRLAAWNMSGYLSGLSSPSVTE